MYSARIMISLQKDESDALLSLSEKERRDPRAQAALLVREALERLGFLQPIPSPQKESARERV